MARKGFLRVAGVIENMGPSVNPDGTITAMFGTGGGQQLADSIGVPLLASIPLDAAVTAGGDSGSPVALAFPKSPAGIVYQQLVDVIVTDVAPPVELAECSLRGALVRAGADLEGARQRAESQRGPR
jgi:ATP-binding protein involved in chromosome partitioning